MRASYLLDWNVLLTELWVSPIAISPSAQMAWLRGIKQAANAAVVRIVVNFVIYFDGLSIWLVLVLSVLISRRAKSLTR